MNESTYTTMKAIRALRREAGEAGDEQQIEICDLALQGDEDALAQCVYIIQCVEDMLDDEDD